MIIKKMVLVILACLLFGCAGPEPQKVQPKPKEKPVLQKLLEQGENVTLAMVFTSIESPRMIELKGEKLFKSFAQAVSTQIISEMEGALLKSYRKYSNFRIIDRFSVDKLLDEYKFQHMGYTREVNAAKIGELLNATHLMFLTYARYINDRKVGQSYKRYMDDIVTIRLIEIQTGALIDSRTIESHDYDGGGMSAWKVKE
jgi:PBP1b-binding outer membrane lipoprotein LpoB